MFTSTHESKSRFGLPSPGTNPSPLESPMDEPRNSESGWRRCLQDHASVSDERRRLMSPFPVLSKERPYFDQVIVTYRNRIAPAQSSLRRGKCPKESAADQRCRCSKPVPIGPLNGKDRHARIWHGIRRLQSIRDCQNRQFAGLAMDYPKSTNGPTHFFAIGEPV